MKFLKLYESYKTQKELEYLAKIILVFIAENTYEKLNSDSQKIRDFEGTILNDINPNNFDELNPFIKKFKNLRIDIVSNDEVEGFQFTDSTKASYVTEGINRYIFIKKDKYIISKVNDSDYFDKRLDHIKSSLSDYENSLLHELQHAYDDFRSSGMAIIEPDGYSKNRQKYDKISSIDLAELKADELEFVGNHYKNYINLRYEVDARFTAAIKKTDFYTLDLDLSIDNNKDVYTIFPFENVKKSFQSNLGDFRFLTDNERWRVLRKLGQFYEIEKDYVKKLNSEQNEYK